MVKPLAIGLMVLAGAGWRASTAPGPAGRGHEKIADDCDSCHLPFKGLPNEKCLTCHTELKQFHASAGIAAQKCVACHGEHKGPTADATKPAARASFDHALTGMPLLGAHAKVPCAKCHTKPIGQMGGTCATCHADTHQGTLGSTCIACHSSKAWKPALHPLTAHQVSMEGGHAKLKECKDCHAKGAHLAATVACAACHEQAHGGTTAPCEGCHEVKAWTPAKFDHAFCTCQLPQKHQTVGCLGCHQDWNFTRTPTLCSGCHEKQRKHEPLGECSLCHSAVSWKKNQFDHNKRAKLKLSGEHLKVACESCHPPQGATLKFRGVPQLCEGCHQKQGDKAHGDFGPCAKCHGVEGFKPSPFDHASTGFPLIGQHTKLGCKSCHAEKTRDYPKGTAPPKKAEVNWLHGAIASSNLEFLRGALAPKNAAPHAKEAACSHCHADPHQGSTKGAGECSACHTNEAFKPTTFTVARHAATAFPLTGKHAQTKCALCHTESKLDDAPKACAGCHVDRHGGRLGAACEKCHSTTAFKPVAAFDHALTGFTLSGGHAQVACAGCHEGKRGAAMQASATPGACATCHQAQHGPELGADCAACHDPAKGPFAKARGMLFAHEKTGFPLERRHATVACGACHAKAGPPPRAACASCHPDPHSGQLGQGCQDCHTPDRFRLVRFDHDRSGWPLRGKHFVTPCASCHTGQRWVGLTTECWDCHATDAARGKARVPGKHPFGPIDCAGCHTSGWTWRGTP